MERHFIGKRDFFRFGETSWADILNQAGFSVWGLDFVGYGRSQPYAEMEQEALPAIEPLGRTGDAVKDIDRAVQAILAKTGTSKLPIVAHSWGTMPAGYFAGARPDLVDRLVLFAPIAQRTQLNQTPRLGPWRFITVEEQKARFVEDVPSGKANLLVEDDFPRWAALYLSFYPSLSGKTNDRLHAGAATLPIERRNRQEEAAFSAIIVCALQRFYAIRAIEHFAVRRNRLTSHKCRKTKGLRVGARTHANASRSKGISWRFVC